ncbi:MAG TPA: DUF6785 family protein [Chthonomonadaceae bacterium]|nr:DUF6785 family protein [Chthonomonadaceae bacterium]
MVEKNPDKTEKPRKISPGRQRAASPRRVFWLGTLLILVNAYFGTYAYVVVQALIWTQTSLLRGPVVLLFFLVLLNLLLLRFARRFALHQSEMLLLYAMLCIGTCTAGYGFVQILINHIAAPFYYASGSNRWKDVLQPHIPHWLVPQDPDVVKAFFRGHTSLYSVPVLTAWAVPVLAWGAFIFAIFWVLLCALTLFRRVWVEQERLTFPLALLPLEMTQGDGSSSFWKNRLMWAGFLLAGLAESVNYVNFLYPWLPSLPIKPIAANRLDQTITTFPWNQAGMVALAFYPFVIGIAYLLSLDVSFSCWFLYVCVKVANVLSAALGFSEGGGGGGADRAPYIGEQSLGAFVGIALFAIWMARRAIADAWRETLRPTGADRDEVMSFRLALVGGGLGLLFLIGFLVAAGMALSLAVVFLLVYLCCALTLARIVSEAGAGWAFAPSWSPTEFTSDVFGARALPAKQLVLLYGYTTWMMDMRDNPMPQQAQSVKLGQSAGMSPRALLWPLVWAAAFGVLCAFWAHLDIYYTYGAATAKVRPALRIGATSGANQAAALIAAPPPQDTAGILAALFGLSMAGLLTLLRQRFAWWPLHPLGYALATTNSMDYMWVPFLIAWLAKWVTLRYGGIRAYRIALPFFLGLILGDYVVPTLWGVWGMMTGTQQYMAFPH